MTIQNDPMKVMVENELVMLYNKFPEGRYRSDTLRSKMDAHYGRNICTIFKSGHHIKAKPCEGDQQVGLGLVQGHHHITDLNVYRKEVHQQFLKNLTDYKFSRTPDDQVTATLIGVLENPEKCWDMRSVNLTQGLIHHYLIDHHERVSMRNRQKYWEVEGRNWKAGRALCEKSVFYNNYLFEG